MVGMAPGVGAIEAATLDRGSVSAKLKGAQDDERRDMSSKSLSSRTMASI
jgi:hypothetical protein